MCPAWNWPISDKTVFPGALAEHAEEPQSPFHHAAGMRVTEGLLVTAPGGWPKLPGSKFPCFILSQVEESGEVSAPPLEEIREVGHLDEREVSNQ